jgi:pyruvate dehydrogenase E1 component
VTATDLDADETQDWLESVDALVATLGLRRARKVLLRAIARAREDGIELASPLVTDYTNTISARAETPFPGDERLAPVLRVPLAD